MNTTETIESPEQHIFQAQDIYQFEYASTGQRCLNYLIDIILMRFGLNWLSGYAIGYIMAAYFPDFYINMILAQGVEYYVTVFIISSVNHLFYYTICEKAFRGYTLGKLITGTRAIREDGQELSFKDALMRSLSRIVPFEPFSAFSGHPWHDTWTRTMVVKSRY